MPRRRPTRLRAQNRVFSPHDGRYSRIGQLSGPAQAEIIGLERTRLGPGVVGRALSRWCSIARAPRGQLPSLFADRCGHPDCCPEPAEERDILESAICALPSKTAREVRRIVERVDQLIIQRQYLDIDRRNGNGWWRDAF